MEPIKEVSNADISQAFGVSNDEVLTPEARRVYEQKESDGLSFKDCFFEKYLKVVLERWNELHRQKNGEDSNIAPLNQTQLRSLVDYDKGSPDNRVICVYCLADLVFKTAGQRGLEIDLKKLQQGPIEELAPYYEKIKPIREEILQNPDSDIYFLPRVWKKILTKSGSLGQRGDFEKDEFGKLRQYGNFVVGIFNNYRSGDQLELGLALGIAFQTEHPKPIILAACGHAGLWNAEGKDHSSHLYCLQTFSGERMQRKKDGVLIRNHSGQPLMETRCYPAKNYLGATQRLQQIEEGHKYGSTRPKETDEELVKDQSCFALSLDAFTPELDKLVSCPGLSEEQTKDIISEYLSHLTPEQVGAAKVFAGENKGDVAEGKTIGKDHDLGKPPGLGFFGGKPETQETYFSDEYLKKILTPFLFEKVIASPHYRRLICGLIREVESESGFVGEIAKIYCRSAKLFKARNNKEHIYNLWLLRMQNPVDTGQTGKVRERREMNANQTRFWFPIDELFRMPVGGLLGSKYKVNRPYCSFLINLSVFLERYRLAIPEGVKEFQKKLESSQHM